MSYNEEPSEETLDRWHQDPDNWVWGIFYYNKEDKRIFPPKRVKWTGWTVNFANTYSVLVFLVLIVFLIIVITR